MLAPGFHKIREKLMFGNDWWRMHKNIYNISGLPPLARSCYTEAAAAVQSAVSADGPGRPCCPGEVIHDLEQVVPRARTASMDYSRLFDD